MTTTISATEDPVRAVLHLRALGPSGLNPPQIEVVDRLRTCAENGPIDDLDVDVWGPSMGVSQTAARDLGDTRETVAEYERWAAKQGCTLRPAFDWRSAESEGDDEGRRERIVPRYSPSPFTRERRFRRSIPT